jgi:hypothetical protein
MNGKYRSEARDTESIKAVLCAMIRLKRLSTPLTAIRQVTTYS